MGQLGQLYTPDLYDSMRQGLNDGRADYKRKTLAQYVQPALGGDQGALAKIYGVDPDAGLQVQQQAGQLQQQGKQLQDQDMQRLGQHARMISALADSGDLQGAAQLYGTIYPEASKILGPGLPQQFDPSMLPHMKQIAQAMDPSAKADYIKGQPGDTFIDPQTGKPAFSIPAAAPKDPDEIRTLRLLQQNPDLLGVKERLAAAGRAPSDGKNKAPSGYRWAADGSLEAIKGGPADKSGGAEAVLGDPNATGEAYLQTIQDPAMRNLVKGIAEGRMQVPRIYRAGKAGEIGPTQIAAAVAQYDPTFNAQDYNSRNRTRIDATSGKMYQNMTALNQVASHLGHLSSQIDDTSGVSAPFGLGTLINKGINAATDPSNGKVTAWNSSADAVAHEVRKLFAGSGGGTERELEGYLSALSADNSAAQKRAALKNIAGLVQSRINILKQGYEQGMGKAGDPFQTTFPDAESTLDNLANGQFGAQAKPAAPQAGNGWSIQKVN